MKLAWSHHRSAWLLFAAFALLTAVIYGCGLHGNFIFDDFPNIADNPGIKATDASISSLVRSALSSPSSEFKRPLASLTFAANYLVSGMDPVPMKATNVVIHLLNGWLVFLLMRLICRLVPHPGPNERGAMIAAVIAGLWLLAPINLTGVLYIVQRMESLANLFVLLGLLGYTHARARMQASTSLRWPIFAVLSVGACTVIGLLAKETAVMLPMYAFVADACLFGFRSLRRNAIEPLRDARVIGAFAVFLFLPLVVGLAWLLPGVLKPGAWSTREFTLGTRLLTELRVVVSYVLWTLAPTGNALSFYHDDWTISTGWFHPWTTILSAAVLLGVAWAAVACRRRYPLVTLGLGWFASAHVMTATVLPLELVYEHRNYFASMGLLLAIIPLLVALPRGGEPAALPMVRRTLIVLLGLQSAALLYITARAWDSPLSLAQELAERAPKSPRAQYELGRTYVILTDYDKSSPFTPMVYAPLEAAAAIPGSSILPEQALIFFNSRVHEPIKRAWWESMSSKLEGRKVTVQDESALGSLTDCLHKQLCAFDKQDLLPPFIAALSHPQRSARLLAMYADYLWNLLDDRSLSVKVMREAVQKAPREPGYRVGLAIRLAATGDKAGAREQRAKLASMNVAGAFDEDVARIDQALAAH
jgi:hypothetical protein